MPHIERIKHYIEVDIIFDNAQDRREMGLNEILTQP